MLVVAACALDQPIATSGQIPAKTITIEFHVLARQCLDRFLDLLVGDARLHVTRDGLPLRPRKLRKQPAVLLPAMESKAFHRPWIFGSVVLQDWNVDGGDPRPHTVVAHEGHVAIFGDGLPARVTRKLRPTPLFAVAVEVSDQDIQETGPEKLIGGDLIGLASFESFREFLVLDQFSRAVEAGIRF